HRDDRAVLEVRRVTELVPRPSVLVPVRRNGQPVMAAVDLVGRAQGHHGGPEIRPGREHGVGEDGQYQNQPAQTGAHAQNSSASRRCSARVSRSDRPKMMTNQMTAMADGEPRASVFHSNARFTTYVATVSVPH